MEKCVIGFLIIAGGCFSLTAQTDNTGGDAELRREFAQPPLRWQSRPLWFWNGPLTPERTREQLEGCKARGYYGVGILPAHNMTPGFMTPEFLAQYKTAVEQDFASRNGNLSYIHKVIDGRQVYFVGNSSDDAVDMYLKLRGKLKLEQWDPHTGEISACETEAISVQGVEVTRVRLKLAPVRSVFFVEQL